MRARFVATGLFVILTTLNSRARGDVINITTPQPGSVNVFPGDTANLLPGGSTQFNFNAISGGIANIDGGTVGFSALATGNGSELHLFSGVVNDNFVLNGFNHVGSISGGMIGDDVTLNGNNHVLDLSGGMIGDAITINGFNHTLNVFGSGLAIENDILTGFLADGKPINAPLTVNGFNHTINLQNQVSPVPEPAALLVWSLLAVAGGFVWIVRCHRRTARLRAAAC